MLLLKNKDIYSLQLCENTVYWVHVLAEKTLYGYLAYLHLLVIHQHLNTYLKYNLCLPSLLIGSVNE